MAIATPPQCHSLVTCIPRAASSSSSCCLRPPFASCPMSLDRGLRNLARVSPLAPAIQGNHGLRLKRHAISTAIFAGRRQNDEEVQELTVYEFNEQDRGSPLLLPFNTPTFDFQRLKVVGSLGMLVAFTNKLYSGSLEKRLGITAGVCMIIRYNQEKGGCLYEATYSFYFGDLGHISVQGPYTDYGDTVLAVTGGSGKFIGVYGTVTLKNVKFPTCLFYRFQLYGIPKLPSELIWETVPPTEDVKPFPNASSPGVALPNFTN